MNETDYSEYDKIYPRTDRSLGTGWLCREYLIWNHRYTLAVKEHYLSEFRKLPKPKVRRNAKRKKTTFA